MKEPSADRLPQLPLIGSAAHVLFDPLGVAERAAAIGPVVPVRIVNKTVFMVSHPEAAKRILIDNAANYNKQTRGFDRLRQLLGQGLGTSEGETWRRHRRIVQPAFAKAVVADYAQVMADATTTTLAAWPANKAIDAADAMTHLTMRILGECMLGADFRRVSPVFAKGLAELMSLNQLDRVGLRRLAWWRRSLDEIRDEWDKIVFKIIADRRGSDAKADNLLSMLLRARDSEDESALSDVEVRDEIITMILAGHETMANTLTWALHYISVDQRLQDRLFEEVNDSDDDLPLLSALLTETTRMRPPAWLIGRKCIADDTLCDVRVPARAGIVLNLHNIHRHPDFWPRPDRFDPDRHIDPPERHRCALIPFGAGKRGCVGYGMAMLEGQIILKNVLRRFRLRPGSERRVKAAPLMSMRPKGGLPLLIEPR